jgi:hypothetical protein
MKRSLPRFWHTASVLAFLAAIGTVPSSAAPPDRIEEDWQVVIAAPNPTAVGPQITTSMNPTVDPDAALVTFYLNYRAYPSWKPGGLQSTAFGAVKDNSSEPLVLDSNTQGNEICETASETITWTQRMTVSGGTLHYNIVDGQSTTWGVFGQGVGTLGVSMPTALNDMSEYSPDMSVKTSGVSWQSNLVTSMALLRVRYYSNGTLISTDTTPRTISLGMPTTN